MVLYNMLKVPLLLSFLRFSQANYLKYYFCLILIISVFKDRLKKHVDKDI